MDANDGYLSDVPTHRSMSPSEVSQDLVVSTKALEQHFKEKYSVLRNAYEDRIKRISETINATCKTLLSDEIIHEMKQDKVSSVFVLSHANEIIERHLESDREAYINQLLEKISQQDIMLRHKNKEVFVLREKNIKFEKEQSEKTSLSSSAISQLQNQLRLKIEECEKLRVLSEQREQDIDLLEQSFQQSAKELALIEGFDKKEQIVRAEMKEQLRVVSRERQFLQDENYDLRVKLQAAAEEIDRLQQDREHRVKEEEMNHNRISQLMEQVEKTLEQEANESNLAISTVHEKMKVFRNRLVQELQKERKMNSLLQEELMTIKTIKEDSIKDHRRLQEEETSLRSRIVQEQEKAVAAQHQVKTVTEQLTTYKLQLAEWENRYHNLEDKLSEQSKAFQQEMKLREETVRMETKKSCEQEQRLLEQKTAAFRLHYENEISKLSLSQQQQQQQASPLDTLGLALEDFHLNEVVFRMRKDRDEMLDNHRRTMEEHRQTMETMRNELITRHQNELKTELRRQELDFKMKYEKKLADAQVLLVQAGQNIEKLKLMVKEGRAVITLQNQRMDHLKKEYDALQNTIISTSSTSRLKPAHRVAFGSTVKSQVSSSAPSSRHTTPVRGVSSNHSSNNDNNMCRDKENHSLQSNVSVLDNSTISMSTVQKPMISQQPQPILRTPQSMHNTTMLASADTPMVNNVHMATPNNNLSSNSTPSFQNPQGQLQTIQFLQSQLDADKQYIDQLEATVAQWQGEAEFYQQQIQQLSKENKTLLNNINNASVSNPIYSTAANINNNNTNTGTVSTISSAVLGDLSQSMMMTGQSKVSTQTMMDTQLSSIRGIPPTTYENTMIAGGYDRVQAMAIIEDAQEESRQTKMRCLELENVIVELRVQLEKAEKASQYLNEQLQNPQSLTRQFGLLPKNESVDNATNANNNKNLEKEIARRNEEGEEDISTGGLTMSNMNDENLEVPNINGLVQLQVKLEQSYAISKHWEERYQHQGELLTVTQQELQNEREKMQVLRKREHELFTLLTKVHQTYRQQIHLLRVELDKIKSIAESFVPFAANEKLTTMNQIRYVFKNIFDVAVKKQEKDMKDLRIAMQTAHNTEISILESKFIEQVNALNHKHTKELEKMHEELLARTERALNASMTASAGVGLIVTPNMSILDGSTMSNTSIISSTQDIPSLLHPSNNNVSTNSVKKIGDLSASVGPAAWESVLKGVLQGLRDQEAINSDTTMKVAALGEAHQEPSFAANAAARALIGDDIDRFVVSILQKKYGNSPSTKDAAAKLGKELGY